MQYYLNHSESKQNIKLFEFKISFEFIIFAGMTATQVQKYSKYGIDELINMAKRRVNKFVRERDKGQPCINCLQYRELQAGHFFPTSTHGILRFNTDNIHGECKQCNYFNSQSHSYQYRINLIKKIGQERFEKLERIATERAGHKWDRFTLIDIIEKYGSKV